MTYPCKHGVTRFCRVCEEQKAGRSFAPARCYVAATSDDQMSEASKVVCRWMLEHGMDAIVIKRSDYNEKPEAIAAAT